MLTYNVGDFARLHDHLVSSGRTQDDPRRNVRALLNLLNSLPAEALAGNLVYLNNWAP
jgi:hypothetical protein